jgi:hypothetical protein
MAGDQPRSNKPAWRSESPKAGRKAEVPPAASTQAPAAATTGIGPAWKHQTVSSSDGAWTRSKKLRLLLATGAGLALLGIAAYLIYLLQPLNPASLVLIGAPAEENLAISDNVAGWQSLTSLAGWINQEKDNQRKLPRLLGGEPRELRAIDGWDQELNQAGGFLGRKEKAAILYLALHGGADSQGAYLLVDAPGEGQKNRLRLKQVLDRVGRLPSDMHKVVILDATQVPANWSLGMLHNDFGRELEKLDPEITAIPNLIVISASDVDQRSWISEEWQQSIFGQFLLQGLQGAADDDNSHRVSAWKLYQYVRTNVERWALANRNVKQTPVLLPKSDGQRRAQEIELAAVFKKPESDNEKAPGLNFKVPAELNEAWKKSDRLRAQVPSPAVYTPQLWREYNDTLLQCEHVLRAGDPRGKAGTLFRRLGELERDIDQARALNLPSAANALPMAAALGLPDPWSDEELDERFTRVWIAANEADRQMIWAETLKWATAQGGSGERLRVRFAGFLVNRALTEPRAIDKDKTISLMQTFVGNPRPAEAHFLLMYAHLTRSVLPRGADEQEPPLKLVQEALKVRRLAEATALATGSDRGSHPYSERIYPWIKAKVEAGDRERRRGEDLLFAPSDWWDKAADHLKKAREQYEAAGRDAATVRKAFGLHDQLLAELPYYSRWLAGLHVANEQEEAELRKWLQHVDKLWADSHQLIANLEKPDPKSIADAIRSEEIEGAFLQVKNDFNERSRGLGDAVLQDNWHKHEDVLTVPLIDAPLRKKLLEDARRISASLHRKGAQNLGGGGAGSAKEVAQQQGRMAVAFLGERSISAFLGRDGFGLVQGLIGRPGGEWSRSITQAGDQLAQCWQQAPTKITEWVATSHTQENAGKADADLALADLLTRQVDGAVARRLAPLDPPGEQRRFQVHDLFAEQSWRTYRDHWAAEKKSELYYLAAGRKYLEDAKAQTVRAGDGSKVLPSSRLAKLAPLEKILAKPAPLAIAGVEQVHWTSEPSKKFAFALEPPADTLPGFPLVWRTITGKEEDNKPFLLAQGKETDRAVLADLGADQPQAKVEFPVVVTNRWLANDEKTPPPIPTREPAQLTLNGVFRGHVLARTAQIDLHRVPPTTAITTPRPPNGGIALQADQPTIDLFGENNGVLVLVLDYSGSMTEPADPKKPKGPTRLDEARAALEEVLNKLPNGPVVSVWIFGTAQGIEQGWKPKVWEHGDVKKVMAVVNARKPHGDAGSPIAEAMGAARRDFDVVAEQFPDKAAGFKTMVVLTDGDDNRFTGDIGKYLAKQFQDGVAQAAQVNMVFFQADPKEKARALKQFAVIRELPLAGNFYEATERQRLTEELLKAIKQKLRVRLEQAGTPLSKDAGLEVVLLGKPPTWFSDLKPNIYTARTHTFRQDIDIGPGDYLLVTLRRAGNKISFERALMTKLYFPKDQKEHDNWVFALMQNSRTPNRAAEMMASLESLANRPGDKGTLQQVRPAFVWFEVKAPGASQPLWLRWTNLEKYTAPSWKFDIGRWPSLPGDVIARPVVDAWWISDRSVPPIARTLKRDTGKTLEQDFDNRKVEIEDEEIIIESVQIEKRSVSISPRDKKDDVSCLVVRLRHKTGKPVVAQLSGISTQGIEHRLYSEADRYTGIFWPVREEQTQDLALQLISLESFKKIASHGQLKNLGEPVLADTIPVPQVP